MRNKLRIFHMVITEPLMASITGFGTFWLYMLNDWDVWYSLFMALLMSALMSRVLIREFK